MTNNLTDMIFDDNFNLGPRALYRIAIIASLCF